MIVTRPQTRGVLRVQSLILTAVLTLVALTLTQTFAPRALHPRYADMFAAAKVAQSAANVLHAEKELRGIMQGANIDPNRTGMIGAEYTALTTTPGDVASKRTATNPDVAAWIVRELDALQLARGTPVVIIVSGSFVGANIAAMAAVEALGLKPVVVASLGASMFGANDPAFNWLDMHMALRAHGLIQARVAAAVFGGENGIAGGMDAATIAALRASAARAGAPLVEARPLAALMDGVMAHVQSAAGAPPGAVINVGAALVGLGTCRESYELPPGLARRLACTNGVPGVAIRLAQAGAPLLNIINFRRLALEHGLPFDPVPLPTPGNNVGVFSVLRAER